MFWPRHVVRARLVFWKHARRHTAAAAAAGGYAGCNITHDYNIIAVIPIYAVPRTSGFYYVTIRDVMAVRGILCSRNSGIDEIRRAREYAYYPYTYIYM